MTLEQLIYFSEVYRQKSINAASLNLHISQQSLSSSIRQLEKEFSSEFFTRSHKGVLATPAGDRFYSSAQKIINELLSLQNDLSISNTTQHCKIGLFCSLSASMASQLFHILSNIFPNVFFDLTSITYHDMSHLSDIQIPDIIFTFVSKNKNGHLVNFSLPKDYVLKYLSPKSKKLFIWCKKTHPLAQYNIITPTNLDGTTLVYPKYQTDLKTVQQFFEPLKINFKQYYFTESEDIFRTLLKTGEYITIDFCSAGQPLIHPQLRSESDLVLKPLSDDFDETYFILLYQKDYEKFYFPIADYLTQNFDI